MNRINLLKPDVVTGYLENGKGQEVTFLRVNPNLDRSRLNEDILNGGAHLGEVLEAGTRKPSRFVVIKCRSREEGLSAVSYLSSIYNGYEHVEPMDEYDNPNEVCMVQNIKYEDFSAPEEDFDDDEPFDIETDISTFEWEESSKWEENPWLIPIVSMNELCNDMDEPMHMFFSGNKGFGAMDASRNHVPYWKYTRRENFCIVFDTYSDSFDFNGRSFSENVFKRYGGNRHVFLLVVDPIGYERESRCEKDDEEDYVFGGGFIWYEPMLARVVLEYSAEIISMYHSDEALQNYYENLFENWVDHMGYSLAKDFPVSEIVKRMVAMQDESKSQLIEKVIKYAVKDCDEERELTEEDFRVLYKLKGLGFESKEEDKCHNNIKKLQNSLVGMEDIKDQIMNIVEVFKYNKRRSKLGLKTGSYHNVHMMLGAPGTAKTTVAQILGNIMAEEKLLRGNSFISINGAELKGKYVGHSAPKVKQLFDENHIIFVDEAYSISSSDGEDDSFSREAIAQLIIELEKHGMDRLIIFAGYGGPNVSAKDNKMMDFLNSNPGIRSRINSTLFFESYNADQMVAIFKGQARINQYNVSRSVDRYVREYFEERCKEEDFGNGREARSLLENASAEAARRLSGIPEKEITEAMLKEMKTADVRRAIERMRRALNVQKGVGRTRLGF